MADKPISRKTSATAPATKKEAAPAPAVQSVSKPTVSTSGSAAAMAPAAKSKVDAKERQHLVAEAAYYLAQKRHFAPGHQHEDWLAAEKQVDALLAKR